ncbi:3-oxoacyl-ACP reductase FabG [bacterium]|nr:3-oxoacyl-ACP reductase FabG [bacterium]
MYLKDKVAIVTGSGEGIGRTTVLTLAEEGAHVVVNDCDLDKAENVAEEAKKLGIKALAVRANVADKKDVDEMVKKVMDEFGKVDILINNAGRSVNREAGRTPRPFVETEKEDWDYAFDVCLYGVFNCTKAVLPDMIKRKYGKIVNMVSDAGRVGEPFMVSYSTAKGGIVVFQKALAKEVGRYNINVNGVSAGYTKTEKLDQFVKEKQEKMSEPKKKEMLETMLKQYPLQRLGETIDLARACAFLSSDVARHITGQTLSVSGGYSMVS